jgi:adenylate cyclase
VGRTVVMSVSRRINPLSQALAFLLRLVPFSARLLLLAFAGVLTALIVSVFKDSLDTVEESVGALGWTLNAETALEQRISIIAIDEKSLAQEGPWPWSRDTMARLVTALNRVPRASAWG